MLPVYYWSYLCCSSNTHTDADLRMSSSYCVSHVVYGGTHCHQRHLISMNFTDAVGPILSLAFKGFTSQRFASSSRSSSWFHWLREVVQSAFLFAAPLFSWCFGCSRSWDRETTPYLFLHYSNLFCPWHFAESFQLHSIRLVLEKILAMTFIPLSESLSSSNWRVIA